MANIRCGDVAFEHIRAVLFDKDGTLANVEAFLSQLGHRRSRLLDAKVPGVQEPLLMAFGFTNGALNPFGLLAVATRLENEIAAAAYVAETGRDWIEAIQIVQETFREADSAFSPKAKQTPPCEGVLELLSALSSGGDIRLGIVSSDSSQNVRDFVQEYALESHFQLLQGTDQWTDDGSESSPRKPDPAFFHTACQKLDVQPDECLVVGDSPSDFKMACRGGAAGFIGVTWGWSGWSKWVGPQAIAHQSRDIQCYQSPNQGPPAP